MNYNIVIVIETERINFEFFFVFFFYQINVLNTCTNPPRSGKTNESRRRNILSSAQRIYARRVPSSTWEAKKAIDQSTSDVRRAGSVPCDIMCEIRTVSAAAAAAVFGVFLFLSTRRRQH